MDWKIPLFKTYSDDDDVEAVSRVIRSGMYWTNGPDVSELEKEFALYVGRKYALTFNSGTSALHSVLLAHDVRGKEVIVPSFTFISTANAVILAGGKPVFAEIEDGSYALDPSDVAERITKKTRAILPIHYAGGLCRGIKELKEIADDNKILLVEDAAESLGAKADGMLAGSFGDSAMFSFCQNKIVATGEGGMIATDDADVFEKLKLIRSHGRVEAPGCDYFSSADDMDYIEVGYNYRMPSIIAALGRSQLKKADKLIGMRRSNAEYISRGLSQIKDIILPIPTKDFYHVYQMYTIRLKSSKVRDSLQKHLSDEGIMTKVYFNPVHLKTFYQKAYGCKEGDLPATEDISKRVLTLPFYPTMSRQEMNYLIGSIRSFFS